MGRKNKKQKVEMVWQFIIAAATAANSIRLVNCDDKLSISIKKVLLRLGKRLIHFDTDCSVSETEDLNL